MSKKANPTLIGAFVVGAIAIITILILLLSGNVFSKKKVKVIMYFDGSVTGLNVGAPVRFRGVKIGTVTDIKLVLDKTTNTSEVPVIATIDRNSYLVRLQDRTVKAGEIFLDTKEFVNLGLRAKLQLNSILTGQLFIELELDPGSSYVLHGDGEINEIPTQSTAILEITKTLDKYPIQEVLNNIASTMVSLDKILSDPVIMETVKSLNQTSKDYGLLAKKLVSKTDTLSTEMNTTLKNTSKTLKSAEQTFRNVDKTLVAAKDMLESSNNLLRDDSQLVYSLTDALHELANAARSVRNLADTLEQQPESLLQGKSTGSK